MKKIVNIVILLCIIFIMSMVISGEDIANVNDTAVVDTTGDTYSGTVLVAVNGRYDDEYYTNEQNKRIKAEKANSTPGILTSENNPNLNSTYTAEELYNNGKIEKVDKELISLEPVEIQDSNILKSNSAISEYGIDDIMTLFTDNNNNLDNIDMVCLYIGTHCTVWGVNGYDTEIDIDITIAEQIAAEFDSKYFDMTSKFGSYWYDADGDGKIAIMCYDIDFEKRDGNLGTSYTGGYFWMQDMIDENGYVNASSPNGAISYGMQYCINGIDCIHIDTYPGMGSAVDYLSDVPNSYSTLIHEFQHMINYSYQVQNGGAGYYEAMEAYLNEALSMGAEHYIYGAESVSGRIKHYNNITSKLTYGAPLIYWESTLDNNSLSYLFGQYIRTQYGLKLGFGNDGSGIYNYILNNRNSGNEEDTLGIIAGVLGISKEELITDFWVALYKKDDTGVYGFAGETAFDNVIPDIKALTNNDTVYNGGAMYYYIAGNASSEDSVTPSAYGLYSRFVSIGYAPVLSDINGAGLSETSGRFAFTSDEAGTIYYKESGTEITDKSGITSSQTMITGANTVSLTSLTSSATAVYYYAKDSAGNETGIGNVNISAYVAPAVITYKLNVISEPGGVINSDVSGYYKEGQKIVVSAGPVIGYVFDRWISSNGGYFDAPGSMVAIFTMPGNDTTITATFDYLYSMLYTPVAINYIIEASAAGGGKILPNGITSVDNGSNMTFTFIPDKGYKLYDVLVDNISIGAVNNYTFTNAGASHTIKAIFIDEEAYADDDNLKPLDPVYDWPFDDVSENDSDVKFVYENNLFKGITPDTFGPDFNMTRAMFVTILGRLAKIDMDDYTGVSFTDVKEGQWYSAYVEWALQNGFVSGYGNGLFGPEDLITFEQAAQMLLNYDKPAKYKENSGADLRETDAMSWAVNNSLIDATVMPLVYVTRAQTAHIIKAFCNKLSL